MSATDLAGALRPTGRRPASDDRAALERVRTRLAVGAAAGDLRELPGRARRAVAVAAAVGAPALPALDAAGAALADDVRARRAVHVATAQARAVAAGLVLAPLALVPLLGRLLGTDLTAFYTTPAGVLVGVAGCGLLVVGALLVVVLVRRVGARPRPRARRPPAVAALVGVAVGLVAGPLPGVALAAVLWWRGRRELPPVSADVDEAADLVAVALSGGTSHGEALRLAAGQLPGLASPLRRLGLALDLDAAAHASASDDAELAPLARLREVLATAGCWGAAAAPALRRLASDLRADELARVLAAAERLPAQLTFPTALCLLPATLVLVGAPLIAEGLRAAGA